jgi:hypothetical protein
MRRVGAGSRAVIGLQTYNGLSEQTDPKLDHGASRPACRVLVKPPQAPWRRAEIAAAPRASPRVERRPGCMHRLRYHR